MRVHGDKRIERRNGIKNLNHYLDARGILKEDFHSLCGYCGKSEKRMHERFHIDHLVPQSVDEERKNDYYNLVYACPKCNLSKSNKWPTHNPKLLNDGEKGFVDPATEEFDQHLERDEKGYVVGITKVGESICEMLHFDLRRTDLYWQINRLSEIEDRLEVLFQENKLNEEEKDFYIKTNIILKEYIDQAFEQGE